MEKTKIKKRRIFLFVFVLVLAGGGLDRAALAAENKISLTEVFMPPALYPQNAEQNLSEDGKLALQAVAEFCHAFYTQRKIDKAMTYVDSSRFYTDRRVLDVREHVQGFLMNEMPDSGIPWFVERVSVFTKKDYPFVEGHALLKQFLETDDTFYLVNGVLTTVDQSPDILSYRGVILLLKKVDKTFLIVGYSNNY